MAHSAQPLLRRARNARPRRVTARQCTSGARSSRRLQPIAAAARPGDRNTWRETAAKRVCVQHANEQPHRSPAANGCIHRPCALQAVCRPSGAVTAPNVEPAGGLGLRERTLSAGGRRAHCGGNAGCARGGYGARSAHAAARALKRADTASAERHVSEEGVHGAPPSRAPFALKPRRVTQIMPRLSAGAPLGS